MGFIRSFQERLSEFGMALFITANAEDFDLALDYLQWIDTIIQAYINFIGKGIIYSRHGEEILNNYNLTNYFEKFMSFEFFKGEYYTTGKTWTKETIDLEFLQAYLEQSGFGTLIDIASNYLDNPFELIVTINRLLAEKIEYNYDDFTKLVGELVNKIPDPQEDILKTLLHPDWVLLVNPFIDLDWTVIKTYIQLYQSYIDFFDKLEEKQVSRYHLWHGTRNIWVEWTENGITKRKIMRGSFSGFTGEMVVTGTFPYSAVFKQLDTLEISEVMPRASRFTLSLPLKDVIDIMKKADNNTATIILEHEGAESNKQTIKLTDTLLLVEKITTEYIMPDPSLEVITLENQINAFDGDEQTAWITQIITRCNDAYNIYGIKITLTLNKTTDVVLTIITRQNISDYQECPPYSFPYQVTTFIGVRVKATDEQGNEVFNQNYDSFWSKTKHVITINNAKEVEIFQRMERTSQDLRSKATFEIYEIKIEENKQT